MTLTAASKTALAAKQQETMKSSRQRLELALRRIVNGNPHVVAKGAKPSASAVAKEAGVDRVTLYRFHQPILDEIRRLGDATPRAQLRKRQSDLAQAAARLAEYRKLVEDAQAEVTLLARENYRLQSRVTEVEALLQVRDKTIVGLQKQVNLPSTPVPLRGR